MDSIRDTIIDLLEKILFQLNLLFDLENTTAYLILKPFFRNIAQDPLVFIITLMAIFLIPYVMIRVRRNTVIQGEKAEKLLKKLETVNSIEIPEEELELPEPKPALYDKAPEIYFEEDEGAKTEEQTAKADNLSDPELEFLKDLDLDSMYTKTYSIEDRLEETESKEDQVHGEHPEESSSSDAIKDFDSSWEFNEDEGPGEPVISQLTEEDTASSDFGDDLIEFAETETTNIEEPPKEDAADKSQDRVNTIDELTRQMEATIESISNQIIDEDIDEIDIPKIPSEVMDVVEENKDSSAATFFTSEYSGKEGSNSTDDDEPAITTPIPQQETNESSLDDAGDNESENLDYTFSTEESIHSEDTQDTEDTSLNKLLGFPFEDEEDETSEPVSANASEEEKEKPTVNAPKPRFPENLEQSEILAPAELVEDLEAIISEPEESQPVESETTSETESIAAETSDPEPDAQKVVDKAENKTKLLVSRLENFQKHLEKRLTTLELTLEKRKTGHES